MVPLCCSSLLLPPCTFSAGLTSGCREFPAPVPGAPLHPCLTSVSQGLFVSWAFFSFIFLTAAMPCFSPSLNTHLRGATLLAEQQDTSSNDCIGASWKHMELSGMGCVQSGADSAHRNHPNNHPAANTLTQLPHGRTKVSINRHLCPKRHDVSNLINTFTRGKG